MSPNAQKIQALLFVAGEAVALTELALVVNIPVEEVESALQEIDSAVSSQGISLLRTTKEAQLVTSPAVSDFLQQYLEAQATDISKAGAEVLSLVAYRGPLTRLEIDAIRGVDCRRALGQLVAHGFVERRKKAAQAPTYDITPDFLQHVGLTAREQLPRFTELSQAQSLQAILDSDKPL